jgi:phosphate transport system substrate-binding protein
MFYQILTDQPGRNAWPITGATFVLMHTMQENPENAAQVLKFFDWSFRYGQKLADELDYVPLPDNVVKLIEDAWKTQIKVTGGKAAWG